MSKFYSLTEDTPPILEGLHSLGQETGSHENHTPMWQDLYTPQSHQQSHATIFTGIETKEKYNFMYISL